MSETEKGGNDFQDDKSLLKDDSTAEKYSLKKEQRDFKQNIKTLKNCSTETPTTQVGHEKSESVFGSPLGNTNGDSSEESLSGNNVKLDLIELADGNKNRENKIRREDLTKGEIEDICGDKDGRNKNKYSKRRTPGLDPRFQEQNQTLRCFVMYTDFYRCEKILGQGETACQWFKDVFTTICPLDWVRRWDEAREEGTLPWMKGRTQGKFPGDRYGV